MVYPTDFQSYFQKARFHKKNLEKSKVSTLTSNVFRMNYSKGQLISKGLFFQFSLKSNKKFLAKINIFKFLFFGELKGLKFPFEARKPWLIANQFSAYSILLNLFKHENKPSWKTVLNNIVYHNEITKYLFGLPHTTWFSQRVKPCPIGNYVILSV